MLMGLNSSRVGKPTRPDVALALDPRTLAVCEDCVELLLGRAPEGTLNRPRSRAGHAQSLRIRGTHAVPEDAEACGSVRVPAGSRFESFAGLLAFREAERRSPGLPW